MNEASPLNPLDIPALEGDGSVEIEGLIEGPPAMEYKSAASGLTIDDRDGGSKASNKTSDGNRSFRSDNNEHKDDSKAFRCDDRTFRSDSAKIDFTTALSSNPFDLLEGKMYVTSTSKKEDRESGRKLQETDDSELVSFLKKPKAETKRKEKSKPQIVNKLKLRHHNEIQIKTKKYFKFPFSYRIKNDGSDLCTAIAKELSFALSSAYTNYKKFNEPFRLRMGAEMIEFHDDIRCTSGLRDVLVSDGIVFRERDECLIVEKHEMAIIYDVVTNADNFRPKFFPFVFSEFEFDGAIVYHTSVEEKPVINTERGKEYSYVVNGPLHTEDFLFDSDVELEILE